MKDIDITILNNPVLRQDFVKKFLLSWNDFRLDRKDFIKNIAQNHNINFDETLEWVIAFTHETLDWHTDDLMTEAKSRLCIIHNK